MSNGSFAQRSDRARKLPGGEDRASVHKKTLPEKRERMLSEPGMLQTFSY